MRIIGDWWKLINENMIRVPMDYNGVTNYQLFCLEVSEVKNVRMGGCVFAKRKPRLKSPEWKIS